MEFSHKWRYIVGFEIFEMAISTNQKPTIYRHLCVKRVNIYYRLHGRDDQRVDLISPYNDRPG